MRNWDRFLFAMASAGGILGLVFLSGVAVGKFQYPPYDLLNRASDAGRALWEIYFPDQGPRGDGPWPAGGVLRWDRDAAQAGVTFMFLSDEAGTGAILVDMAGRELHRWRLNYSEAFPQAPHLVSRAPDERLIWHGFHLYPDGDVVLSFEGGNFPSGSGLVRIDKDSRVVWTLARNTHHDVDVLPDGRIVTLAHEYLEEGVPACADYARGPYLADSVLIVSPEGRELESFSLAEALCNSPYRWAMSLWGTYTLQLPQKPAVDDLLHTNNVEVVRPAQAAVFPMADAGDFLVSFRNLNMVAVVDKDTRLVKWALTGHFVRQHDPDILPNGNLLVYDNLGGWLTNPEGTGRSRVLEIDPKTQAVVWQYVGGPTPQERFDTAMFGKLSKLANGNVLISMERRGRVIEVTADARPRIVWEYVNVIAPLPEGGRTGAATAAGRLSPQDLTFLAPTS